MSKIGKRFGQLTVLREAERSAKGNKRYLCKCDCGNAKVLMGTNLAATKSCGCMHDLTGRRYGKLLVVGRLSKHPKNQRLWLCHCDCGTQITATTTQLNTGRKKSCGCSRKKSPKIDITGRRFGRLVATRYLGSNTNSRHQWECRCDCGQIITADSSTLRQGRKRSCGCIMAERTKNTLGLSQTPEYKIYREMLQRCHNLNHIHYKQYGQRGITVCDEWRQSFIQFQRDVGRRPDPKQTLERIDNDKGYYPGNCGWVTQKENNRNKRTNRLVTYKGVTKPLVVWAETLGIPVNTLGWRLTNWSTQRAFTEPLKNKSSRFPRRKQG